MAACPACGAAADSPGRAAVTFNRRTAANEVFSSKEKSVLRIALWVAAAGALVTAAALTIKPF